MTCPECEMYYPEGDRTCWSCARGEACQGGRCGTPIEHECPEPFGDVAVAISWLQAARYVPIHPRTKAAAILTLKRSGELFL